MAQGRGGGRGGGIGKLAAQQVRAAEVPILTQIQQERAANLQRAQAQMGFAKAAAAIMQQAAPNVQQGYTNAANADAGYARGLGNAVQAPIAQNTAANNVFLTNMGTPQGALRAAPPVGDLAYGVHGYIPATSLQREGAAWGAAAQLAPGNTLHQGQQAAAGILGNDPTLAKLQASLAGIAATQPEVYQRLLQTYTGLRQSQQRINLEGQSLQLRAQDQAAMQAYRQASLQMQQERIGLSRRKDAAALAQAIQKGHQPDVSLSKIYGYIVDANGNPILAKGKRIPVKTSTKSGLGSGSSYFPGGASGTNPKGGGLYQGVAGAVGKAGKGIETAAEKAVGAQLVQMAHQYVGDPYLWGGESPKGFDCSGFAQYLYNKVGISIPRTAAEQWLAPNGRKVQPKGLKPGDLVFYKGADGTWTSPGHVGLYIGSGKVINAYGAGYGVRIDDVFSPAMGGYIGARRYY